MQLVISVYYFVYLFAGAATSPFLSLYLSGKGVDSTHIGLLFAVGSVVGILAQPIIGLVSDRARDPRRILRISAALSPIVFAGYAIFSGFWPLLIVSVVLSCVQCASPIMDALAVKEGEKSGFTYGQVRLWGALGFAIAAVVAGYVYHIVGMVTSFYVYGALSIIIVWITFYLPNPGSMRPSHEALFKGIWQVARQKTLFLFILISFLLAIANSVNGSFFPLYYQDLHYPMRWFGLNFTVAALIEVPFFYISGRVMERLGFMRVVIMGSALYMVKFAVMALAPGAATVISIQVLDGIAFALYWSAAVQLVSDLAPANRQATAQTLYGAIASSLSGIVGTAGGGYILQQFGPLKMYWFNAILAAVSTVCFIIFARFVMRRHRTHANVSATASSPYSIHTES